MGYRLLQLLALQIAYNTNTNPYPHQKPIFLFASECCTHPNDTSSPKGILRHKTIQNSPSFTTCRKQVICFGNHKQPIDDPPLLLLYSMRGFDGLVESFPSILNLLYMGLYKKKISTSLGLTGIPNLAEEIRIRRDLAILSYTGGKLHIPTISTSGVGLIRQAKKTNSMTCSVAVHNLMMTDDADDFDTRSNSCHHCRSKDQGI